MNMTYEEAIRRIQQINDILDNQEIRLEQISQLYEEANLLIKHCENLINQTEQKVCVYTYEKEK